MAETIYIVGGSKGGVGKSIVAMTITDLLLEKGRGVLVIESDTSNPDVAKAYRDRTKTEILNLDEADGWIELVNLCDKHPTHTVVVNTAARNNTGVASYGTTLNSTLTELKRRAVTLWCINRQRDSLELLNKFMEVMTSSDLHVLRNAYFGEERKYELYNASKTKAAVEARGGKSLTFPELADRVIDDLYIKRLSIEKALAELPIGNRAELTRWRTEAHRVLREVVNA